MRPLINYIEKDLILLLKENNLKAFDELYYRYHPKAKLFARSFIKDQDQCNEVLQEVFIRIWEKRNNIDEYQSFKAYLFQSVKNHILNIFRRNIYECSLDNSMALNHYAKNELQEQIFYAELNEKTNRCIDNLPEMQRQIFKYNRIEGFSNSQIAEKLNISKRTVEHQIYLAIKTLKRKLLTPELHKY
jgi:RNA polymerase sigma-70 factor, ECF subfamily